MNLIQKYIFIIDLKYNYLELLERMPRTSERQILLFEFERVLRYFVLHGQEDSDECQEILELNFLLEGCRFMIPREPRLEYKSTRNALGME